LQLGFGFGRDTPVAALEEFPPIDSDTRIDG
jgi:hypothetical protein